MRSETHKDGNRMDDRKQEKNFPFFQSFAQNFQTSEICHVYSCSVLQCYFSQEPGIDADSQAACRDNTSNCPIHVPMRMLMSNASLKYMPERNDGRGKIQDNLQKGTHN